MTGSLITAQTIADLLAVGCRSAPARAAIVGMDDCQNVSHDQLASLLETAEQNLRSLGIGRQTRVMTALPDGHLTAMVLMALTRAAVCAPINPDLRADEVIQLVPELRAEVLIAHGIAANEARTAAERAGLPIIEVDWDKTTGQLTWTAQSRPTPDAASSAPALPTDTALILLTSGSSARPKRVPLTHQQLTASARRMAASLALSDADCCLNMMPMFHVGAIVDLLLAPLSVGGCVLRPDTMSVPAFYAALDSGRPTWFQGVPTLLHEVVRQFTPGKAERASLRFIRSVSSPLPPDWLAQIESTLSAPVVEIYGMTETAGVITSNPLPPRQRKIGSVGLATDGMEVTIQGAEHPGERGEILVRGAGVMTGYEGRANDEFFTPDGWLKTGDEGYRDDEGYFFITGRIGDQINRGGEKVSPREIDDVLASHPAIQDVAVFGASHAELGQEVAAAIVWKPATAATAAELTAHVSSRLAWFKVPRAFYVVSSLPRGPGGKLRRRLLPEMVQGLTPLSGNSPTAASTDSSELTATEQKIAALWEGELRVPVTDSASDFFELGGDSLGAASFVLELEKQLGIPARPAALFDHPTLRAFASYVDQLAGTTAAQDTRPTLQPPPGTGLNPEYFVRLHAVMQTWPGERASAESLLVGRNASASGPPLFWCVQGQSEFEGLANHWPNNQPTYGLRSLYLFEGKNREDERALARVFAHEVATVHQGREIVLGGFCAGARIAYDAAQFLLEAGVRIKMLILYEFMPVEPIQVPVALGFCKESSFDVRRKFSRPEHRYDRLFPAGWHAAELPAVHNAIFSPEVIQPDVKRLQALLSGEQPFRRQNLVSPAPAAAHRAQITSFIHQKVAKAGARGWAHVRVFNESQSDWLPSSESGLYLGYRWRDAHGQLIGDPGESLPLRRIVPSKKTIHFLLPFVAPAKPGLNTLEVDMINEGVTWFSDRKNARKLSSPLHLPVSIHAPRS
ncbi:MAG: non-ribosomal peptide synthetase [Verrucomicrobiaceae bacterium]|nr:non-ribosomal peptide synthetase [Verrucomicrobiaceae bacterium]